MKKQFTTFLMSAAMMLVATAFTACSSEVEIDDNNNGGKYTAQTIFSSADDDATRTSINNKRAFYWEVGDKIWIFDGANYEVSPQSNITAAKTAKAKFVLDGNYTASSYKVLYTGYANGDTTQTFYDKVTIADVQTQKAWNDGSHLGTSGDCGTAMAFKQTGAPGYKFTLDHKASYLLFYPYLHNDLTGSYTLEKIEVYSDLSSSYIAGDFDFTFDNGLAEQPRTGTGKDGITLNCRNVAGSGFNLQNTAPDLSSTANNAPHCFIVIAPGTHQLTIKYTVKKSGGDTFEFIKDIAIKLYEENYVYTYVHELHDPTIILTEEFYEEFYKWGNLTPFGDSGVYSTSTGETDEGFWSTMPNRTELIAYMVSGKVYYDNSAQWKYHRRNGTEEIRRGGLWLLKKNYHSGTGNTTVIPKQGRPDNAIRGQYFFLPDLDYTWGLSIYWCSTPFVTAGGTSSTHYAYGFEFTSSECKLNINYKNNNFIAGYRDGAIGGTTPWFQ